MEESVSSPIVTDDQESDEFWKHHLERFQDFPGSARNYCRTNGLKYGRFFRFKQKLGLTRKHRPYQKAFVEIKTSEKAPESERKVFRTLKELPDPKWVAQVLTELWKVS
jgi:hypothetical protein